MFDGNELALAQRDHVTQFRIAGLALAVPAAVHGQGKQTGFLGRRVELHPAHKAGVVTHVFRLARCTGNGCSGVVGLAVVQRALQKAVQLATGHINAQPFHATISAALGEDGGQIRRSRAGLILLLNDAGGGVDLHDKGTVFIRHPQRIARSIDYHRFGVQTEFAVALGLAGVGEAVIQNLLTRVASNAAWLNPAIGILGGAELDRQGRDKLGTLLADGDHANRGREVGRRKHGGAGKARGVGAIGDLRDRAGGGVRATIGDGVELQRAVSAPPLEGQSRAISGQKALGKIGLGGRVLPFVGEVKTVVKLHILARDGGADGANASGLRGRFSAANLKRAGIGAAAQQSSCSGGHGHQAG